MPEQYGCLIRTLRERVPNIGRASISVHCHDDLGLAVANSLAGISAGARKLEGTDEIQKDRLGGEEALATLLGPPGEDGERGRLSPRSTLARNQPDRLRL